MSLSDKAKKAVRSAGIAMATTGLTHCEGVGGGVVDPPPPPLNCMTLSGGQTLDAIATRTADSIDVVITIQRTWASWEVASVVAGDGVSLVSTELPPARSGAPLRVKLQLASSTTSSGTFTITGTFFGIAGDSDLCAFTRSFTITIAPGGITVAQLNLDDLPLPARQRAQIHVARRDAAVVELVARSPYRGEHRVSWEVSSGALDKADGNSVRWTLPLEPGIYQARVELDFGADGLAFDTLLLEVTQA
jgi:hypothetical protein